MDREETLWMVIGAGAAVAAALATRSTMRAGWRRRYGDDPPVNPADPEVAWTQAVSWTALSGLFGALAGLLARRAAAAGWTRVTGSRPPGLHRVE